MSQLGQVRIGHKAPDFHCDAVSRGKIEEVSLSTYINESSKSWLLVLFIPAAFSFVCPTEVLAFQNCLDEFQDRNCHVIFVSVDTKHSLWHWQNVPRQYGGLGQTDIALLSDATHKMGRDYGVLIEEEGVCLRGMFIIDDEGIVQQVTLNNLTVGRSVLEALRLLEAFQAVAKHGVLCPVDWKPSTNASETINTISNMLTESYDERLANLQKEFGDTPVTDLDAKHKSDDGSPSNSRQNSTGGSASVKSESSSSKSKSSLDLERRAPTPPRKKSTSSPHRNSTSSMLTHVSFKSPDAPTSGTVTPTATPNKVDPPPLKKQHSVSSTARHARGRGTTPRPPPVQRASSSQVPRLNHSLSSQSHVSQTSSGSLTPNSYQLYKHNTYESRRGSHVILEFADPTSSPQASPSATPASVLPPYPHAYSYSPSQSSAVSSPTRSPALSRQTSSVMQSMVATATKMSPGGEGKTRLQMTFEAIKSMSSGLMSPRLDFSPKKSGGTVSSAAGNGVNGKEEGVKTPGYFDVVVEGMD